MFTTPLDFANCALHQPHDQPIQRINRVIVHFVIGLSAGSTAGVAAFFVGQKSKLTTCHLRQLTKSIFAFSIEIAGTDWKNLDATMNCLEHVLIMS